MTYRQVTASVMHRFILSLLLLGISHPARAQFNVVEATITEMQQAMASGAVTSRELVQQYLTRIALYDRKLNAVFYQGRLTPARYERWLRETGVSWVALPDVELDPSAHAEAASGLPCVRR